jgi:hypothetical protein
MVKTCPHCGSILEERIFSGPMKHAIYEYVRKHPGCNVRQIQDAIYADDPNGGPDTNTINVLMSQMKPRLIENGLRFDTRSGPGATYRLVEIKANPNASV